jgi:P27 family predicted phage terminase small subunit
MVANNRGGRPKKPTGLKVLQGNPGKRALPDDEPLPQVEIPEVPETLRGEAARREWQKIVQMMYDQNLMTGFDADALGLYCQAHGDLVELMDEFDEQGRQFVLVHETSGRHYKNPTYVAIMETRRDLLRYCVEFGMTPSSRAKVSTVTQAKPKDAADEFFATG